MKVFIDTNIFLYANDQRAGEKQLQAKNWLFALAEINLGFTNLQVINEATNALIRKRWYDRPEQVFAAVDNIATFGSDPVTLHTTHRARDIHSSTHYSWWDSLLLASAIELGCTHFLSEDLQDGHVLGGLTIMDPFAHSPATIIQA